MRRIFNTRKDVYLLVGPTLVAFRKDCKNKEAEPTESVKWVYELFMASVSALSKSRRLFKDNEEYELFINECEKSLRKVAYETK